MSVGKYNPLSVANGFLGIGLASGADIDPMKIQKLCWFANGYYLAASGDNAPLITEQFEAWPFGPVNRSIYDAFKSFRSGRIDRLAQVYNWTSKRVVSANPPDDDALFASIRDQVWGLYGIKNSWELSQLTHQKDGAWQRTWSLAKGVSGRPISNEDIMSEFKPLLAAA